MAATFRRVLVPQQGNYDFQIVDVPKPTPGDSEVLVKIKSAALNPADWKKIDYGLMVQSWPFVAGLEGAGVVAAVGEGVTKYKEGDEVFGMFVGNSTAGTFQEYAVQKESVLMRKPSGMTFSDVSGLPICTLTAWAAIHVGLGISIAPLVPGTAETGNKPKTVLVLGGSSLVGALAIVALHMLDPSTIILTTSSPAHHSHLKSLGATAAFDRKTPSLLEDIRAATPSNVGVDAILDAVQGAAAQPEILDALSPSGLKLLEEVPGGPSVKDAALAKGVNFKAVGGFDLISAQGGYGAWTALEKLVAEGKWKMPIEVDVVGHGLDSVKDAVVQLKKGVSGKKLVVEL